MTLQTAWERWEQHPGDERAAANMVAACSLYGDKLGIGYTEFRRKLSYHRRRGLSLHQVCDLVERTINEVSQG